MAYIALGGLDARYQPAITALSYAATVTPAITGGVNAVVNIGALTGNVTITNPTVTGTLADGQTLRFRMSQDATGGRITSYGTGYAFGTDITAAMDPLDVSAKWERAFQYNSNDSKWRAVAIARGF